MKILFAAAFIISVCYVTSENCSRDSDCVLTKCGTDFSLDCYSRDHVCTCIPNSDFSCSGTNGGDACKLHFGDCTHGDHHWHCIDGRCRCSFFG